MNPEFREAAKALYSHENGRTGFSGRKSMVADSYKIRRELNEIFDRQSSGKVRQVRFPVLNQQVEIRVLIPDGQPFYATLNTLDKPGSIAASNSSNFSIVGIFFPVS